MPALSQIIAQHPALKRRVVVPAYRAAARANVFLPGPRVFANSFPKGGTHLLSSLLGHLPRMMYSGVHRAAGDFLAPGAAVDEGMDMRALRRALRSVNGGQFMTGHFPHTPGLCRELDDLGYASVVIMRDPRDILVSSQFYVQRMRDHDLHRRFTESLETTDDRLMALITGFSADEYGRGQASIGDRLERFMGWWTAPGVLTVRFEDLVGPAGGGHADVQQRTVAEVARHAGRPLTPQSVARVAEAVWSSKSSTFRSGVAGGWREHFGAEHVAAFKRVAGHHLVRLGYEPDEAW